MAYDTEYVLCSLMSSITVRETCDFFLILKFGVTAIGSTSDVTNYHGVFNGGGGIGRCPLAGIQKLLDKSFSLLAAIGP